MAKADFEGAKKRFPSVGMDEEAWLEAMTKNPDVMWTILADIYNIVKDEEERAGGKKRMGRRPTRAASSLDDLMDTVIPPQFTTEPFAESLRKLMVGRSQQQFARVVPCDQSTISRLLSGELRPDLVMIVRIAGAAKVPPHYFVEYRALYIGAVIERVLTEHPHLGVAAFKRLRSAAYV